MSAPKSDSSEPMVEMNTTPLIDVMLVLLIMFIITLPPPTHAVKIDLPQDCAPNCPELPPVEPVKNRLYIAPNGAIQWNETFVGMAQLVTLLNETQDKTKFADEPELHFAPDPMAPYDTVDKVLALTKRAKINKLGFIGNENYISSF
jgi:biopolymer transport protein ExbD